MQIARPFGIPGGGNKEFNNRRVRIIACDEDTLSLWGTDRRNVFLIVTFRSQCSRCYVDGDWTTGNFTADDIDCGKHVECNAWDYDTSEFRTTIATEVKEVPCLRF